MTSKGGKTNETGNPAATLTSGARLIEMSVKRELTERNKFYSNSIPHYRDIK